VAAGEVLPQITEAVRPGLAATASTRRRLSVLLLDDGVGLTLYLRIVLLLDVMAWISAAAAVRRASSELRQLLVAVGEVDALLAIASWRHSARPMTVPEPRPTFVGAVVQQMCHPLLDQPVPSSLELDGKSILVTGSNMSGKTTFLKALGVNAVLAQTIGFAMANRWSLPSLQVVTSIGRADNLIEGRSYYLAEVEAVARMVRVVGDGREHLFLADEIFRGTNATERIGAAVAVLQYLASEDDLVLAATHDLELAEMLRDRYKTVHFAEDLGEDGLSFDYRLRQGVTTGRTAIDLLEHVGYPEEVVLEARRLVAGLEGTRPAPQ
jgi:DNA mismatch repair ATPase MutS